MKICVFCASSESVDNVYFKAAADLGKEIVTRGWGLLYGGTNCGLMREVSDAVKNGGGEVTGIIPQCIVDRGVSAEGISELIVAPDMKERKSMMREKADAFIALPRSKGRASTPCYATRRKGASMEPRSSTTARAAC